MAQGSGGAGPRGAEIWVALAAEVAGCGAGTAASGAGQAAGTGALEHPAAGSEGSGEIGGVAGRGAVFSGLVMGQQWVLRSFRGRPKGFRLILNRVKETGSS